MTDIKKYARALKLGGYTEEQARELVTVLVSSNGYEMDTEQALAQAQAIFRADRVRGLSHDINEWVFASQGWWHTKALDQELGLAQIDRTNRRVILHRLVEAGVLERDDKRNGIFRKREAEAEEIPWELADISAVVGIKWPFGLENYALTYPKTLSVIAGSPNAGKTAFLLNVIKMNQDRFNIHYYSSEMGPEEMRVRLSKFKGVNWKFDARERSTNFGDVIHPNDMNIIDYMEVSGDFWRIGEEFRIIFDRLDKGIAIVALQKKRDFKTFKGENVKVDLGRGAEFSLEKPRLYLAMDNNVLRIIKAKAWAVEGQNPNGAEFNFKLINGATFIEGG